jgi:hypothetical protein
MYMVAEVDNGERDVSKSHGRSGRSPRLRLSKIFPHEGFYMGCMSGFDESVESMFRRFSNAISFAKVNRRIIMCSNACIWNSYR